MNIYSAIFLAWNEANVISVLGKIRKLSPQTLLPFESLFTFMNQFVPCGVNFRGTFEYEKLLVLILELIFG